MKLNRWFLIPMVLGLLLAIPGCEPDAEVEGDEAGECDDGVDNDQDGPVDCDDPGCATATACVGDDDAVGDDDDSSIDDDDAVDDDDSGPDDDDAADDDDTTDSCAAAVPCMGNFDVNNGFDLEQIALCESITGNLEIAGQGWLSGIDLSCLTAVGGDLYIFSNDALTNLDGLSNLTSVGGLSIYLNPSLCQSVVDAFVAACTVSGPVSTYGNDDGC